METLSRHDLLALNKAIGEIYTARDLASFHAAVFRSIREMIAYEFCSFNDVRLTPTHFLKIFPSSHDQACILQKLLPVFNDCIHEHPLIPQFPLAHVFKTTDAVSIKKFKSTTLYNEYYRHLGTEMQIGFSMPTGHDMVSILALSRNAADFSERDRLLLAQLKPHLINAMRNVTELGRVMLERDLLHTGMETERQGAILLQSDGMILCISSLAQELCGKYFRAAFAEGDTLPVTLLHWFNTEINAFWKIGTATKSLQRVERDPLVVEMAGKKLKIRLFSAPATGEYVLFLVESDPALLLHSMRKYGLSSRETEVLNWLAQGKTNVEVATILKMSKRTADKHLENIFDKLGVGTRAAAIAIMRRESALF